ncbi:hypothetical protein SAMN04487928_11731 [Butyrivibrio proteoclasticus]|uniref:Uncharacterized protein n=1 Tax=Butyrivibrio proteoclasticus TaxID=43305 RepID=A0A1I5VGP6_9FIRM|nr:hypothetical protein [Butyrivibrio proteoclasticus]SFQ06660.1 hypothetical protein SAMN04487928_11731 [Butyrivibrio proteoclasticus]
MLIKCRLIRINSQYTLLFSYEIRIRWRVTCNLIRINGQHTLLFSYRIRIRQRATYNPIRTRREKGARDSHIVRIKTKNCAGLIRTLAMLGVGVGAYSDSEHVAALREGLVKELDAIAKAEGIGRKK